GRYQEVLPPGGGQVALQIGRRMLATQGDEVVGVGYEDGEVQLGRAGAVGYVHRVEAGAVDALVQRYRTGRAGCRHVAEQAAHPVGEPGVLVERAQVQQRVRE